VKHPTPPRILVAGGLEDRVLEEKIREATSAMGLELAAGDITTLATHLRMVLERNRVLNLTRITGEAESVLLHVADSLSALSAVAVAPRGRLADIGSGAGYPGVPLAVVSTRPTTLVESRGRKAEFLAEVVREIGLDADVAAVRAEELALERARGYAVVTARALGSLGALLELASPLLIDGGLLVALKGSPKPTELRSADGVAELVGMRPVSVEKASLPGSGAARTLVTYVREGVSRVALPRRPGDAQRRPLG
jgi:16S rRNA (guanine527-N7)-methyltransferase